MAKGRRVERLDLSGDPPGEATLRSAMVGSSTNLVDLLLGRSGKLRAPTLRVGDRLLVGYNREMLEATFGAP